ncbi:hypothetical protein ACMFMG_003434 [Clarireedia jacksonii]
MFLVLPFGPVAPLKESSKVVNEDVVPAIASIEIQSMQQSVEAKTLEEDWTGTSSAAMRRKLQNRLNQRASRKRKRLAQIAEASKQETGIPILYPSRRPSPMEDICINKSNQARMLSARSFNNLVPKDSLSLDSYLLTLLHFNLFRALSTNVHLLKLELTEMSDEILSPFNNLSLNSDDSPSVTLDLPPSLQPTELQKSIQHHPEIDVFPFPECRDNVLIAISNGDGWNDIEFCHDLFYGIEDGDGRTGLIVWGDPWDPSNWEVEEQFAKKWAWLLKGCKDLFTSTNEWRAKREERLLTWE